MTVDVQVQRRAKALEQRHRTGMAGRTGETRLLRLIARDRAVDRAQHLSEPSRIGGYVKIVDRKKDMILVSGFNVFPNEIEDVLAMLPGVLEVAVIGVPDERAGEAVKVFIVKRDAVLTEGQVLEHCRANLTAYENPKQDVFLDALPKSTVGMVLQRELRR